MKFATILARADITADNDPSTITVKQPSLDELADQITNAQNNVVACQAALHKAQLEVEDAEEIFIDAVTQRVPQLKSTKE